MSPTTKVNRFVAPFGTPVFRGVGGHGPFTRFRAPVRVPGVPRLQFCRFVVRPELIGFALVQWWIDGVEQLAGPVSFGALQHIPGDSLDLSTIRSDSVMLIDVAGRVPGHLLPGFAVVLKPWRSQ